MSGVLTSVVVMIRPFSFQPHRPQPNRVICELYVFCIYDVELQNKKVYDYITSATPSSYALHCIK